MEGIGATSFDSYTAETQMIIDIADNVTDCCSYKNQILDKFCARQFPVSALCLYCIMCMYMYLYMNMYL